MEINLKLSIEKMNVIMMALSKMPYEMVFGLIQEIDEQARPQVNNAPRVVGPPPD